MYQRGVVVESYVVEKASVQELEKGCILKTITDSNKLSLIYYRFELFRFVASTGERVYQAFKETRLAFEFMKDPLRALLSLSS